MESTVVLTLLPLQASLRISLFSGSPDPTHSQFMTEAINVIVIHLVSPLWQCTCIIYNMILLLKATFLKSML